MTLEDLHSDANPQLVCIKNNLFNMHHDNKACEMCEATFVASTVRSAALFVRDLCEVSSSKDAGIESPGQV